MDGQLCRRFFLEPALTFHRRYEALRAVFVDERPVEEIAKQYGYKHAAFKVTVSRFRAQCREGCIPPFSFLMAGDDQSVYVPAKTCMAPKKQQSPIVDA
jgi:hypothetical protein